MLDASSARMMLSGPVEVFGVKLVGVSGESGRKLLLTVAVLIALWLIGKILRAAVRLILRGRSDARAAFWSRQAVHLILTAIGILGFLSIWFDQPGRLTSAVGLVTAGLAVALSRLVTAIAGYFIILTSKVFNVGDRIVMGGVRGDVIALGYIRTTILEMGQPPPVQKDEPAMWVEARQYTGRIVTVTNDRIFEEPVYNFSRDFPYIWEELRIGVKYGADRDRAEQILLEAARRHGAETTAIVEDDLRELRRRYFIENASVEPRVYMRLTDNWVELALRFVVPTRGVRDIKDAMARDILREFDAAGLEVASATFEVVGLPKIEIARGRGSG